MKLELDCNYQCERGADLNLTEYAVTAKKAAQWDIFESELLVLKDVPETLIFHQGKVYKISLASPEDADRISRSMQKMR